MQKQADTAVPAHAIPFDDAVREGKDIVARIEAADRDQFRLGELAHKVVHPTYGDRTFANYAKAIGIEKSTLGHYRTVYRKWEGKLPPGAKLPSFTVLKELEAVPERAELIKAEPRMSKRRAEVHRFLKDHPHAAEIREEHPNLTCTKQARKIMDTYDAGGAGNGKGSSNKDYKRWFKAQVKRCNEDMDEAAIVDQPMTAAQLSKLLEGVEPGLLETLKSCSEAWLTLYGFLTKLCEEGPEAVFEERERERCAKEDAAKAERRAKTAQTTVDSSVGA